MFLVTVVLGWEPREVCILLAICMGLTCWLLVRMHQIKRLVDDLEIIELC